MAKGKAANPADAYRKAQRKKEIKKNKAERQKNRDFALVKKDTTEIEEEIEQLEKKETPSATEQARLKELKADLEKVNKKKEEWVEEHPEHRKLVFKPKRRPQDEETRPPSSIGPTSRNLFKKNGLPRHPERSIYYDPVMNPYGLPPPGMPYMEKPLPPEGSKGQEQDNSDSDDDIVMPEGPPPGVEEEPVDSDDDIPMPEGPPPSKEQGFSSHVRPVVLLSQQPLPPAIPPYPVPSMYPIPLPPTGFIPPPPPPQFIPPPPLGFPGIPPPPPGFAVVPYPTPPVPGLPPLPPGFPIPPMPYSNTPVPMPPPPPGFFPRKRPGSGQDPLSTIPHRTLQGHPSLPPKPGSVKSDAISSSATVSAEPELRDLRKESTAFMPTSVKRKKAPATPKVNAAPSVGTTEEVEPTAPRPDLLSTLQGQFGPASPEPTAKKAKTGTKDDYAKFIEEMGDIL
ncbi:hypothetical protein BDM02DRAFT_3177050 [Thelephora ganbajun]|uniref:Uncharacterized protein n=1 Tax=Thelephora ganbajun TaxID=370292 RepID=A0ACB6ZWY9_THEGA|nr:hypothetical protein BDM02DRAFT_3177050 [Thelephora ganbajun]